MLALLIAGCAQQRDVASGTLREHRRLSSDCLAAVEAINQQAREKSDQARAARERSGPELAELAELYPFARGAWNNKVDLIKRNGPGFSAGFGPLHGNGEEFTTDDIPPEAKRFFQLLEEAATGGTGNGRGRDAVGDVALSESAQMMPQVSRLLRRLKNQCADEHEEVMRALDPQRFPERFEDL